MLTNTLAMAQALWRPLTALIMSAVVIATSLGWLPANAEEHANSLLTTAGGVLAVLAASRTVQRVQESKAGNPAAVADEVAARLRELLAEFTPPPPPPTGP